MTSVFDEYSVDQEVVAVVFHAVLVFLESSAVVLVRLEVFQLVELTPDQAVEVKLFVVPVVLVILLVFQEVVKLQLVEAVSLVIREVLKVSLQEVV